MDQGQEVGRLAHQLFPGGVKVDGLWIPISFPSLRRSRSVRGMHCNRDAKDRTCNSTRMDWRATVTRPIFCTKWSVSVTLVSHGRRTAGWVYDQCRF